MYNQKHEHLVPQILKDRAEALVSKTGTPETKENYAQQLEVVRDFCDKFLTQYRKTTKFKHKASV